MAIIISQHVYWMHGGDARPGLKNIIYISKKKFTRGSDKLPLTIAADQGKNLISMTVKFFATLTITYGMPVDLHN